MKIFCGLRTLSANPCLLRIHQQNRSVAKLTHASFLVNVHAEYTLYCIAVQHESHVFRN